MSRVENMFGPRENWGKGDEMAVVRDRAARGAAPGSARRNTSKGTHAGSNQKAPRDRVRETPPRTAAQAKAAGFNKGAGIAGFVSIKCRECGRIANTCLHEKRTVFNCKVCGHPNPLEGLVNIHFLCPRCGFKGNYRSNRREKQIVMECLNCSAIVDMTRIRRGNYIPEVEAIDPE